MGQLRHEWVEFKEFAFSYLFDFAKGCIVLLAFYGFGFILHLGKALGMEEEYLQAFERIHFWSTFGVYLFLVLDFGWRFIAVSLFRSKRESQ